MKPADGGLLVRARTRLLVIALLISAGCDDAHQEPASPPVELSFAVDSSLLARLPSGATADALRRGQLLYRNCSVCHGLEAEGTQLGPALSDSVWIHIGGEVDEIAGIIRAGVPTPREYPIPMPAMGGDDLSEDEVNLLSTYVLARSLAGG